MDASTDQRRHHLGAKPPAGKAKIPAHAGEAPAADEAAAAESPIEDTAAIRSRRVQRAELELALARKTCPNCGTTGCWTVEGRDSQDRRIRYVKCRGCTQNGKVVLAQ